MSLDDDFTTWCKTGLLCGIGIGSPLAQCEQHLPDWHYVGSLDDAEVYRWNGIEFYFLHSEAKEVYQIFVDDPQVIGHLTGLTMPDLPALKQRFADQNITYQTRNSRNPRLDQCLECAGGLSLYFLPSAKAERLDYIVQR